MGSVGLPAMDDTPLMPYRRLGRSGLQVSVLSFGSWVTFGDPARHEPRQGVPRPPPATAA